MARPVTLPEITPQTCIPRLLHQVYVGSNIPSDFRHNVDDLIARNPSWKYTLYDEPAITSFIQEHYGPDVLSRYSRIDPAYGAARADLFRYLALYRLGGAYLDVKSNVERPLDETIREDDQYIISQWRNGPGEPHAGFGRDVELAHVPGGAYQQWHIVSVAGHPFLGAVIKAVLNEIDTYSVYKNKTGRIGVFRTTGPVVYTQTIAPLLELYPCRIVRNETEVGLRYSNHDGLQHQRMAKTPHYSKLTTPVVRNRGVRRILDLAYVEARKSFGRIKPVQRES